MTSLPLRITVLLIASLFAACGPKPEPPKTPEPGKAAISPTPPVAERKTTPAPRIAKKVLSVEGLTVQPVEGDSGKLAISAIGGVNSGGWSQPELRPRPVQAGSGTLVFDFFALPPDSTETRPPTLGKLHLKITVDKPEGYQDVKVVARMNSMTAK